MGIPFPPPPREKKDERQFEQWIETAWRYVRPSCTTSGDAPATIPDGATYHGVTALGAPRTITLPEAKTMLDGESIVIQDESGLAGTHTITVAAAAGDTLNGSVTIASNYGRRTVIKRGAALWYSQ